MALCKTLFPSTEVEFVKNKISCPYHKAAFKYCEDHSLSVKWMVVSTVCPPNWHKDVKLSECPIQYVIALTRGNKSITFDYWGSIADRRKTYVNGQWVARHPSLYDIISVVQSDMFAPTTVAEYYDEYGYDCGTKIDQVEAIVAHTKKLQSFFNWDNAKQDLIALEL